MGSRGAFISIDKNDFSFVDGGQNYKAIGIDKQTNAKYLIQEKGSVKVPDYSHSANQIYAVIQNDQVKTIAIYENHRKIVSIDLMHPHNGETPHVHTDLFHVENARTPTLQEFDLINKIKKGLRRFL